jgi:threonine dehydrogenase-like Zn-dependent dehydrogenase
MKALQLQAIGRLKLAELPVPCPAAEQLLVRTGAAVICTSDLNDIRDNPFRIPLPVVLGHEGAGTVAAVGRKVRGFKPGDRIAAHPVHPCRRCAECRAGHGHLCAAMGHFGLNMPGTFAAYFLVRADRARRIPARMPFPTAALVEPVCVCLEALAQARLKPGDRLLVLGDGPFGILTAMLAANLRLAKTVVMGHHDFRLSFARRAVRINAAKAGDAVARARAQTAGIGYDAVILAVGRAAVAQEGIALLRPKGRLVVFAAIPGRTPLDLFRVSVKELEIVGACNDQDRLDGALGVLVRRSSELGSLVTHRLALHDYERAFALAARGHDRVMKVALTFPEP